MLSVKHDVSRRICPHCSKSVSFKTYKAHRRLFYDATRDHWLSSSHTSSSGLENQGAPSSFGEMHDHDSGLESAPSQIYHDISKPIQYDILPPGTREA